MDTEVLISEVCKRRVLWDKKSKQHHNRYMLMKAWSEVASFMDCSVKEARTKWKNLKDHFRKEYRKEEERSLENNEPDPEGSITWSHYKSLLFLKDQFVPKKQMDLPVELDSLELPVEIDKMGLPVELDDIKTEKEDEVNRTKTEKDILDTTDQDGSSYVVGSNQENGQQIEPLKTKSSELSESKFRSMKLKTLMKMQKQNNASWGPAKKRHKAFESTFDAQIEDAKALGVGDKKVGKENENYHFVMTLLPHLDRLPPAKRLAVQIKIQQAVFSAIYGNNRSSSDSTTSYDSTSSF